MDGARWVYDSDELGTIRRDVMTILTHHAASRQAAMAPYGKMLLSGGEPRPLVAARWTKPVNHRGRHERRRHPS